jgi:hypothetical protein
LLKGIGLTDGGLGGIVKHGGNDTELGVNRGIAPGRVERKETRKTLVHPF